MDYLMRTVGRKVMMRYYERAIDIAKKEGKIELLNNWIDRLKTVKREDCIFPLAGQEFRNKVIEFINEEKIKIYSM